MVVANNNITSLMHQKPAVGGKKICINDAKKAGKKKKKPLYAEFSWTDNGGDADPCEHDFRDVAWEDANLPAPAWAAVNRENGHAHLAYGLSAPVLVAENARRQPIRFLQGIEGAYREALQADRGYSGLITKNPKHPLWRVLYGPQKLWELGELAEYGNVEKYIPRHAKKPGEIGLGRNCITFEFLRQWSYRSIRAAKKRGNFVMWQADCNNRGLIRNADFAYPLGGREVWHIAKSVAMWTWRRFDIEASDLRFHDLQSFRGIAGNVAKWGDNDNKRASARLMRAAGQQIPAIAAQLGVSERTVQRWTNG